MFNFTKAIISLTLVSRSLVGPSVTVLVRALGVTGTGPPKLIQIEEVWLQGNGPPMDLNQDPLSQDRELGPSSWPLGVGELSVPLSCFSLAS